MVSDEKQYEFITSRITDLSNATEDGLKLFLPMYSAILGGSIWLRLQVKGPVPSAYQVLSDVLMLLLTAVCIAVMLYNLWAWWAFQKLLVKITSDSKYPAKPPRRVSTIIEAALAIGMGAACGMYLAHNPFGFPN